MSVARSHAEWLELVEASGPFLSMPVLLRVFPQGLDVHDSDHFRDLRQAYGEWLKACGDGRHDPAIHSEWVRFVLRRTLGFTDEVLHEAAGNPATPHAHMALHGETLRPDLYIASPPDHPGGAKNRLLVQIVPPSQDLEKPLSGARWKASPATRMMELLHTANVRLGLVTNGECWMLVNAPRGETTGFATWYADLWLEEKVTLQAFRSLLSVRRFFGVAEGDTIEALLIESSRDQQDVTDQLGLQVRKAVEVLIQALDRIDEDRGRTLLAGVDEKVLYEAALTVMMRLVFLFSAEEGGLLLLGDEAYDRHYAVSTLRAQLREDAEHHGEEVLERRRDAWGRLLATFRAVYGGIEHEAIRLPAYGGNLFDPDRVPFLEGRPLGTSWRKSPAEPLPIHNRTVLHLLEALQILQVKVPGGGPAEARRLSFRALDIEQIGHVYEGLLDHTAVRAKPPEAPVLGLVGTKEKEPEIPLPTLEELKRKGEHALVEFLEEETGRSTKALRKAMSLELPRDDQRFIVACGNDGDLLGRVRPFAGLVREDTNGHPVLIREGSVYVTQGADRRTTGTHYTPRHLTEEIVQHTLDPIAYDGPAEGRPTDQWKLKPPRELLKIRVCDFAMGSGAFLVQTCRYLSELLAEAWEQIEAASPGQIVITPEGDLSAGSPAEQPIPRDATERLTVARRIVADRCLFGVDKNPMAVEMAKLSLWLVTLQKDRPFTFLDHALRCGDSLLGITSARQIETCRLMPKAAQQIPLFAEAVSRALETALDKRRQLESFTVNQISDAEEKARLLREAEEATEVVCLIGDLIVGAALASAGKRRSALEDELEAVAAQVSDALQASLSREEGESRLEALRRHASETLNAGLRKGHPPRRPFHWALEFPEIFATEGEMARGFESIVSNPPFLGGKKISGPLGTDYREYLVEKIARGTKGNADLCAYFFLRASQLLQPRGGFGMLATNTIAQGDTREVGLDQLQADGCTIARAVASQEWPGTANLEVSVVWVRRGPWNGDHVLDGEDVKAISPSLAIQGKIEGKPYRLAANVGKSFIGSFVLGMGFVLTPEEAQALIAMDPRNKDVLFPYLNGEDLNSRWDQSASRWVINFRDWPLDRDAAPAGYSGPVASDYPDCLAIIEAQVRPERQRKKPDGSYVLRRPLPLRYWHYADKRPELYATIAGMDRVLVTARVSPTNAMAWCKTGIVFHEKIVVFPTAQDAWFALLQSSLHWEWARAYTSTLGAVTLNYSPSDCFDTFPIATGLDLIGDVGRRFDQSRSRLMAERMDGLTSIYNLFHDPGQTRGNIALLRELHAEMDRAVAAAYGWTDLALGHGFHETKQGMRFTITEAARREVLARLLELNHKRYVEEAARGLHAKRQSKGGTTGRTKRIQAGVRLFDE